MKVFKKFLVFALVFSVIFSQNVFAGQKNIFSEKTKETYKYLTECLNEADSLYGMEWVLFGICAYDSGNTENYKKKYIKDIENYIKERNGVLSRNKYTEYSKAVILLSALGEKNFTVCGYNLIEKLEDYGKVTAQGVTGAAFALIALDCTGDLGHEDLKNKYIDFIINRQNEDGGFSLSGSSIPDITSMAVYALAGHRDLKDVSVTIDKALEYLSLSQNEDGGYTANGISSSEYTSQVIMALCEMGISAEDERFVKNGNTLMDNLMDYNIDGGFSHIENGDKNLIATEQAFYSLVNASRIKEGKLSIYKEIISSAENTEKQVLKDISGHENEKAINSLYEKSIISGKGNNLFDPDSTVTRAEFAAMIVKALGLKLVDIESFKDVKKGSWYEVYVDTAYANGIIRGVSENEFMPEKNIAIEQAMVMISKSAEIMNKEKTDFLDFSVLEKFDDGSEGSSWAKDSTVYCIMNNIFWKENGKINHKKSIKRCETAQMIYNLLEK